MPVVSLFLVLRNSAITSCFLLQANSLRAGQVEVQDPVLANVSSCSVDELSIPGKTSCVALVFSVFFYQ